MGGPTATPPRTRAGAKGARRVLGFVGEPANGVTYVRFLQPFRYLADAGFELATLGRDLTLVRQGGEIVLADAYFDAVDAILFPQMVASPRLAGGAPLDLVTPSCELAARRGIKIIYSLDDDPWAIDRNNPAYERIRESIGNAQTLLDHADAIFVTTPALRDALAGRGGPIHVLPNAIEPARWRQRPRTSSELRVGWAGSSSHVDDLLMVLPAVAELQRRIECRFILMGLTPNPIADEAAAVRRAMRRFEGAQRERAEAFVEMAARLADLRHDHIPFTDLDSYIELLPRADLDVGLCPLVDNRFNRAKSALKSYEYAACGTVSVASDVLPYREEASLLVANERHAWCDALERLLKDPGLRDAELVRQRAFVLAERNIETMADRWAEALRRTLDGDRAGLHRTG